MCCLFGIIDYNNTLSAKQKSRMISILATECEERGTDATGIAYNSNGKLHIFKKPLAAHLMRFKIPGDTTCIMGHTRLATSGDPKFNFQNHPFPSKVKGRGFALAHNGVLYNDVELRITEGLPDTKIETDSYVAVQLIEKKKSLNFNSLRYMAEKVEGSFTFTVMDDRDNLYFVKGENPMCIYHYPKLGIYIYASTKEILEKALKKMGMPRKGVEVEIECGDILMIDSEGKQTRSEFLLKESYWSWRHYPYSYSYEYIPTPKKANSKIEQEYIEDLRTVASFCGYHPTIVDEFIDDGFTLDEVVDMLYHGDV